MVLFHLSCLQVQQEVGKTTAEAEKRSARITATPDQLAKQSHVAHTIQVIAGQMLALSHAQVEAL